ncbi:hypothetical protein EZV62_019123 [Acer yangbiense]|uniref:Uncharacterized protein n=1 Tax=Acer yangbiense TaxID=1000413 RepID=A0A5C7HAH9_9ROSI|nr:hypothetical protein EZV62_019123 [Acer yangbiense]
MGTLVGIGGAMLFTFCKGAETNISSNHLDLLHHDNPHSGGYVASSHASSAKHLLGLLLALGSKDEYEKPMSIFKHSFDVFDGINPSHSLCSLHGKGQRSMAIRVEY